MDRHHQDLAREHLMLHFTDMAELAEHGVPMIVRGEGVRVIDEDGAAYIDGLSGLYCTNLGHSFGDEIGAAAHEQMKELPFVSNWTIAHPRAVELAAKVAELAPPSLNRAFFTSGGSESVEAAWKLARQWHQANGEPYRRKAIARRYAYHGTTLGALSFTGISSMKTMFEPLPVPVHHVSNTNAYRHPAGADESAFTQALLDEIEEVIEFETPETVAMIIAEPVQNAGGSIPPPAGYWQGLREICDRYGILLCSDEVICAWGRLGDWYGANRLGYEPDLLTFAKGLTSAHFAMGGVLLSDKVAAPFLAGDAYYMHGMTFGGHPVGSTVALKNIEIMEREGILDHVLELEPYVQAGMERLMAEHPIIGNVRGMGFFWSMELVKDRETREPVAGPEGEKFLSEILSPRIKHNGLICRLDDRADPAVQLAPPLVSTTEDFDQIFAAVGEALDYASARAPWDAVRA